MKIQSASLILMAVLVGSTASKPLQFPCFGWGVPFGWCHDNWDVICADFDSCANPLTTSLPEAFTTVPVGYTPAPGECVCVSDGPSTGFPIVSSDQPSSAAFDASTPATVVDLVCSCKLLNSFWEWRLNFTGATYDIYIAWFVKLQEIVLLDIPKQDKFCQIGAHVGNILETCPEIAVFIQFQQIIVGVEFYVCDLVTVAIELTVEVGIEVLFEVVDESCHLFDCILGNDTDSKYNNFTDSEYNNFVVMLTYIIEAFVECDRLNYTYIDKCIILYKEFTLFFQAHPNIEIEVFLSIYIQGYGLLGEIWAVCKTYFELYALSASIGSTPSTVTDCPMMVALQAAGYDAQSNPSGVRQQLQQLHTSYTSDLASCEDEDTRHAILFNSTWQWVILNEWATINLLSVNWTYKYEGVTGSMNLYRLIWLFFFSQQFGFVCHHPLPPSLPSTTTEAPTTPFACCDSFNLQVLFTDNDADSNGFLDSLRSCSLLANFTTQMTPVINRCHTQYISSATVSTWSNNALNMFVYLSKKPVPSAQTSLVQCEITYNGNSYGRFCDLIHCDMFYQYLYTNTTLFCAS